ncbi:hydroxypyruvate isomerase family protein [Hydrogenophaga sp. SL48]|uniref:hydroxypyruvate isomerase family protein n=1 Tax=Hydrogenophaga sp. SL48 TaxID=2806347 RepID=UPI001F2F7300|nr:TIM barrel protein [Hydrogenophaga sp. SL48]UJW83130.1 TIM barrel protein [Hydrogenophaga sp. SL48]
MKLSAHIGFLFTEHQPLERIRRAAAAGFSGIEWPSLYQEDLDELSQLGVELNLHWPIVVLPQGQAHKQERGLAALPGRQSEFRDGLDQAVAHAQRLGSHLINPMAGVGVDLDDPRVMATYLENLWLSQHVARRHGLGVAIEVISEVSIPGYVLSDYQYVDKLIKELPGLGLVFDTFHAAQLTGDPVSVVHVLGKHIAHVQLGDHPGRHEPYTGIIDFAATFQALRSVDYDGWFGCEYLPAQGTEAGLGWMERLSGVLPVLDQGAASQV